MTRQGLELVALSLALGVAACGKEDEQVPWDPPEPDSNYAYLCEANDAPFPPFGKACQTSADCTTYPHVWSCCGDQVSVGVNAEQVSTFEQPELACRAAFLPCACTAQPPRAEDGASAAAGRIDVSCVEGLCTTTVTEDAAAGGAAP